MRTEKLGVPTVFVVGGGFFEDATNSVTSQGMAYARIVEVTGYRWHNQTPEEKRPLAEGAIDDIIDALTRPLTPEEANPGPLPIADVKTPITITAGINESAVDKFNDVFLGKHWGDGLALVPPTAERVKWILTGTSRSPDEVIDTVALKYGVATVEKIAINAVMAGAKREYLPVIISAMEALSDHDFELVHPMASTGCFNLAIVVSGPIVTEIDMNFGTGFLGYGSRGNNTIGRSLRLALINLGHIWPGENDLCQVGRENPHTFHTFAETPDSAWPPYHVSQGYQPEDSAVTVFTIGGSRASFGSGYVAGNTIQNIINNVAKERSIFADFLRTDISNTQKAFKTRYIVINPTMAEAVVAAGYTTQESLANYIYETTRVPYEQLTANEISGLQERIKKTEEGTTVINGHIIPPDRMSVFKEALKPGGRVPVLATPEDIHFIVAGSIPGSSFGFDYMRSPYTVWEHMHRVISGATLTEAGR